MTITRISNAKRVATVSIGASSGFHPEAMAWLARVHANGGSASTETLSAVSRFCAAIDAAGIRSLMYRTNLFCGSNLSACLVPLYSSTAIGGSVLGNATDTNVNFVSGDYSESQGLTATSAGKVLNTGVTSSLMPSNSGHAAWSIRNGSFLASGFLFGFNNSGGYRTYVFISNAASQSVGCASGSFAENFEGTSVYARWIASRESLSVFRDYRNGVLTQTSTTTVTATTGSTDQFSVFGANGSASARAGLHYYSIGGSLTATQSQAFDAAASAFLVALGRS